MSTAAAYQARKAVSAETGQCIRPGCKVDATEDSLHCATHLMAERAYKAKWAKRRRKQARRARRCPDCPQTAPRLKPTERIWCTAHRIARNRISALHAGGVENHVEKSVRIALATHKDPTNRTRYHGQQRRGPQTHAQLNAQDVGMADQSYQAFKAGLTLIGSDEAKTWTRGERERVVAATANQGERACRHVDDVLERLGHFKRRHGRRDGE